MLTAVVAVSVILLDQASKFLATRALNLWEPNSIIDGFFSLTLVHNRGAAFGLLPQQTTLFIFLSLFTITLLLLFYRRFFSRGTPFRLSAGLILGGAVGNLIDRLRYNYVVDFLDFQFGSYHWPAFNLADSAICLGVACLIGLVLFQKKPEDQNINDEIRNPKSE